MLIKAAAHTVVNSIRITEKLRNWFVATAPAPDFAHAPACCFDKPVWHYVKSGRPELFMYDRDSIKA
jgi:hypothetical protein